MRLECAIKKLFTGPPLCYPHLRKIKSIKCYILNKVVLKTVQVSKSIVFALKYLLVTNYGWLMHSKINKKHFRVTKHMEG